MPPEGRVVSRKQLSKTRRFLEFDALLGDAFQSAGAPSWRPRSTEQKERHLAHSLSARLRWLRGPDLNRRPSGYEFTKAGFRVPTQAIEIAQKP